MAGVTTERHAGGEAERFYQKGHDQAAGPAVDRRDELASDAYARSPQRWPRSAGTILRKV
jgi:hypothetical protein